MPPRYEGWASQLHLDLQLPFGSAFWAAPQSSLALQQCFEVSMQTPPAAESAVFDTEHSDKNLISAVLQVLVADAMARIEHSICCCT